MPDEKPRRSPTGPHNPYVEREPRGRFGTPLATPPIETPGPSVTPPLLPESETEREEWADRTKPSREQPGADPPTPGLVNEETSAAAAEAAAIGGPAPDRDADDPAMSPVYQAGGGDQEGFEQAEADLIENASHGAGYANPLRDAISPELESDRSSAAYGGADDEPVTELTRDPEEGPDDPGAGPGLAADRGS
jgi:hypothetical protein